MPSAGEISIELAVENSANELAALSVRTFVESYAEFNTESDMKKYLAEHFTIEKIEAELIDSQIFYFLVRLDNQPIGYAKLRTVEAPEELKNENPIELERIYVLKEHQDKKIGKQLLKHCLNFSHKKGFPVLWLGVWENNHKAITFYKSQGFEVFGTHTFKLGDDIQTDPILKISTSNH